MKHLFWTFLLVVLFKEQNVYAQDEEADDPIVETAYGPVLGNRSYYEDLMFEEFLGIPFAAPPVGELRWQKPVPPEPWTDVLNTTVYSRHCTQFIAFGYPFIGVSPRHGEDCLYLNVYVPGGVQADSGRKLPVMVWIYGGAFFFGTGAMYPGQQLALRGDVVVVNFNYRVSTLGFLSTGDFEAPGNYGLWDQHAAIKWVKENIASFNGDPDRITIFGQSAGAASVSHAVISPHTQGLFQNAISVSGGATGYFGLTERPLHTAMVLGDLLNCSAHDTRELVDCLRQEEDPYKLDFWGFVGTMLASGRLTNLVPVIDGDYVPRHPVESFKMGIGKDINFITGSCYDDGAGFILSNPTGLPALGDTNNVAWTNESIWAFGRSMLSWAENRDEVFNEIIKMYPDIYSEDNHTRTLALNRAVTEWWFGSAANWEATQHFRAAGAGKTFEYQFKYRQSFLVGFPDWVTGTHMDDIYSFIGDQFLEFYRRVYLRRPYSRDDKEMSRTIMDYFTNFAHTGNPNQGLHPPAVEWAEFNPASQDYLQESIPPSMESFYGDNVVDRYRFWTEVYPKLFVKLPPATFPPPDEYETLRVGNKKITEEDIMEAVDLTKDYLRSMVPDEEDWVIMEEMIDQYVYEREATLL